MDLPPGTSPALYTAVEMTVPRRRRPLRACLAVGGILVLAGAIAWTAGLWRKPRPAAEETGEATVPPDPRLTYDGPFLNVRPDVKYVGDAVCAGCHPTHHETFRRHPMGRSIVPVSEAASGPLYESPTPFKAFGSEFWMERRGDRVWNRQRLTDAHGRTLAEFAAEVHYVIGSGHRGHSYLSERDGRLYQTSISWFGQKKKWDISPRFQNTSLRPVPGHCLYCHAGGARPVEGQVNLYEQPALIGPAIGCERCHGPGELHVESRQRDELPRGPVDHTIVNPRHLKPELREQVCQQCHLEGAARVVRRGRGLFDFRPGLRLDDFWSIYVPAKDDGHHRKAVSHVEQMYDSKCFKASAGKLGCISCHDPHEAVRPEARVHFYRDRCLQCHEQQHPCTEEREVRLRKAPGDSCIDCHMPRFSSTDIAHTAATDHSIPRRPGQTHQPRPAAGPAAHPLPLVHFHRGPLRRDDLEACRDLGIAMVIAARRRHGANAHDLPVALDLLDRAVQRSRQDIPLLLALADCLILLRRYDQALGAVEQVLALEPGHESALREAAELSQAVNRFDDARRYLRRAIALYPNEPDNHQFLAIIAVRQRRWREALAAADEVVRLEPTRFQGYVIRACCYEKLGDPERAARERAIAETIQTPDKEWFLSVFERIVGP